MSMDSISIEVCENGFFIPTAFSPNKDDNNDKLYVRGNCIKSITFKVYDRWGNKVFETDDINIGWDGSTFFTTISTINGQELNSGIYVYFVEATLLDGTKETRKGNISLMR